MYVDTANNINVPDIIQHTADHLYLFIYSMLYYCEFKKKKRRNMQKWWQKKTPPNVTKPTREYLYWPYINVFIMCVLMCKKQLYCFVEKKIDRDNKTNNSNKKKTINIMNICIQTNSDKQTKEDRIVFTKKKPLLLKLLHTNY